MTDDTMAEIDAMMQPKRVYIAPPAAPSPSPAAPPSPDMGFGQAQGFFAALKEYEGWRKTIIDTELGKMQSIENMVEKRVQASLDNAAQASPDAIDPEVKDLLSFFKEALVQNRNVAPQAQAQPLLGGTTYQAGNAQPRPQDAAAKPEEPMKLTEEQAYGYADMIFEKFPSDVLAFKDGKVARELALKKIKEADRRVTDEIAEQIVKAIENTDYSHPEGDNGTANPDSA